MATAVNPQYGISGFIDGLANLSLLYGAKAIQNKFPEQSETLARQELQDNAVNELRAQQALQSASTSRMLLIGGAVVAGVALLMFAGRK